MKKAFDIPEAYSYLIAKYNYIYFRRTEAITFLLTQHFSDETDEFCDNEKLTEILNEAINAKIKEAETINGVLALITEDEMVAGAKRLTTDRFMEKIYVEEMI